MDSILETIYSTISSQRTEQRPKVCLTWAQSLDGRLSTTSHSPTLISGHQSMQMTHALRALHDAILIGAGTLRSDNPRLTCRVDDDTCKSINRAVKASEIDQENGLCVYACHSSALDPVPVILDTNLSIPSDARCLHARADPHCARPFVFYHFDNSNRTDASAFRNLMQPVQVPLTETRRSSQARLDLHSVLHELRTKEMTSLMVEGGASVISSFLQSDLWDIAVVTISPQLFRSGVTLSSVDFEDRIKSTHFSDSKWIQLGEDIIFIGFPP